jgi:tRNA G18 (ribose-2'-O)-methylase SpoU
MNMIRIDSANDERLADYTGIREAHLRRDSPTTPGGRFIAEGEVVFRTLIESACQVRSVLCTPARLETIADALDRLDANVPVYVAGLDVMSGVAGFHVHRGLIAIGIRGQEPDLDQLLRSNLLIVIEDIANHDNIGGIFRNAAAFGAGAVLLSPRCCDPLYRKALRVSVGHALTVPWARLTTWPGGLAQIRQAGLQLIGLTPERGAIDISDLDQPARRALLLGAEGPGLSDAALDACDVTCRIPIANGVDSLNVAVASGIALHRLSEGSNDARPGSTRAVDSPDL